MERWRVQLLGGLRVERDGEVVKRFRSRSADTIFAYLALHLGHQIPRIKLEELGWPDSEPLQRQQNLRTALSSIRSSLGPEVLHADRLSVCLSPSHFVVDALEFRRSRSLSLYRGRLLEGVEALALLPLADELEEIYALAVAEQMERLPAEEAIQLGQEVLRRDPELVGVRAKLRELDQGDHSQRPRANPFIVTKFIGRQTELGELSEIIINNRLVTLTGLGGTGKTRIAAEIWSRKRPDAWFVSLAEVSDPGFVGEAIRLGLRLPPSSHLHGRELVAASLYEESGMLVLDNFEHLLQARETVEFLLANCPKLRILITSRVSLGIEGEVEYVVGPMETTSDGKTTLTESAQLFQDRAKAVYASFSITTGNARSVEELCARLDGFPLSLEFAAAKSRIFTPAEMLKQLNDRFEFLVSPEGGERHKLPSLLDALDWSFDRLSGADQRLLCQLSVFEGGFTLDAAEYVCGSAKWGVQIETLLMSAWVQRTEGVDSSRFRLLESVRDYGSSLLKPAEQAVLRESHATYFLNLAIRCGDAAFMPDEPLIHGLVRDDIYNIESAYEWLQINDPERTLALVASLNWYWIISGQSHLGEERIKAALQKVDQTPRKVIGRSLHHSGNFLLFQGRFAEAEDWFRRAFAVCRQVEDLVFCGLAACQWGRVLAELGRDDEARARLDESLYCLLQVGDDNWLWGVYTTRSLTANRAGELDQALEAGKLAVNHGRKGGYQWGLAASLNELAMACHLAGDYSTALAVQQESILIKRELEALPSLAISLADLAATYLAMKEHTLARQTLEECASILKRLHDHENYPKLFATAAELLWLSGQLELATQCLVKMLELTSGRRVSASEVQARDSAMGRMKSSPVKALGVFSTKQIVDALVGP